MNAKLNGKAESTHASVLRKRNIDQQNENVDDINDETDVIEKTAKWVVQSFHMLPEWLKDNEYLISGHRPPIPSFADCFKSIFSIHSETGNIWTHLIGCVSFILIALWFLTHTSDKVALQEKIVFSFFFVGAVICLGCSFLFHTVSCHSQFVLKFFRKLDYTGISLLIIGSFIPWLYYGFYCRPLPKYLYISMITVFGFAAIIVSMSNKFTQPDFRHIRALVFVIMGLSAVFPAFHLMYTDGLEKLINENSFIPLVIMAFLYIFGAMLYGARIPEKYFPGKCDIWFQSHQLFHICVVIAALTHYYGVQKMAFLRLNDKC
jgi:adiponectin receptor